MDTHHPNTPKVRKRGKGEEERDAVCPCEDDESGNLELQIRWRRWEEEWNFRGKGGRWLGSPRRGRTPFMREWRRERRGVLMWKRNHRVLNWVGKNEVRKICKDFNHYLQKLKNWMPPVRLIYRGLTFMSVRIFFFLTLLKKMWQGMEHCKQMLGYVHDNLKIQYTKN